MKFSRNIAKLNKISPKFRQKAFAKFRTVFYISVISDGFYLLKKLLKQEHLWPWFVKNVRVFRRPP
jgi:hypothetical protein